MGACLSSPTSSSPPAGAAARRPRKRKAASPKPDKDAAEPRAATVEFGYERDFEARYEVGRLLGHGQFGYTFAAT